MAAKQTKTQKHQKQVPPISQNAALSHIHGTGIFLHLVAAQLLLQLVRHKVLVLAQVRLHVDLELDRVVQDPVDVRVELLAQRVRPDRELLEPASVLVASGTSWSLSLRGNVLDVGVHLLLLHVLDRLR